MGFLKKKVSKDEQVKTGIVTQTHENLDINLENVYNQEQIEEKQLRCQMNHPPRFTFKPENYKAAKAQEITTLRANYSKAVNIDTIEKTKKQQDELQNRLAAKRNKKEPNVPLDVETEFKNLDAINVDDIYIIANDKIGKVKENINVFCKLKKDKNHIWTPEKMEALKAQIKKNYEGGLRAIVANILGDSKTNDEETRTKYLLEKHPDLVGMYYYSQLLKDIYTECGRVIRDSGNNAFGHMNVKEYTNVYGQRQIIGYLTAEIGASRNKLLEEYDQYVEASEEGLVSSEDLGKFNEQGEIKSDVKDLWDIYDRCNNYMKDPDKFNGFKPDYKRKFIQNLSNFGILDGMGELSEITKMKSSWLDIPNYGVTFLCKKDPELFWECMKLAVLEKLGEAYGNPDFAVNGRYPNASKKITNYVINKRGKLKKDEIYQEKVEKLKKDFFSNYRRDTMNGISWDENYGFAYYEFMYDEFMKTINYNKSKEGKPGLFSSKDFDIFNSNDVNALQQYVDGFRDNFRDKFAGKDNIPSVDDYYYCLNTYIKKRIKAINKINNKTKLVSNNKYVLTKKNDKTYRLKASEKHGYSLTVQTSGQGCWSVAMSKMLESRGINLSQNEIRAYKSGLNKEHYNYITDSYNSNINCGSTVEDHMDLLAKVLPDQIMYQTLWENVDNEAKANKLLDAADKAILENGTPLVILYKGHFRIIYGRMDESLLMHDPLDGDKSEINATELAEETGSKVSVFWLADKPKIKDGRAVISNKEGHDLYYDKDGNIQHEKFNDEVCNADTSVYHYNYYKYCIGQEYGENGTEYNYVYLTDNKRKDNNPKDKIIIDDKQAKDALEKAREKEKAEKEKEARNRVEPQQQA